MRGIVIGSPSAEWQRLRQGLESSGLFSCLRRFDPTDHADLLKQVIRVQSPHVIILDVTSFPHLGLIRELAVQVNPHIQIVASGADLSGDKVLGLMRGGVREYLPAPFTETELAGPLTRIQQRADLNAAAFPFSEDVFVFLPAQAGVGATTLAVQTAMALAEDRKRKTLLVDLDISNGLISFLLRLTNPIPMSQAMGRDVELDDEMLARLVASRGHLDVAQSSEMQFGGRLDPDWMMELLAAARRRYQTICVDVSEALEEHAVAVMQEAREIFLVCTPEVQALYLARKRMMELERLGLAGRVRVIVNRSTSNDRVKPNQVADLLGVAEYLPIVNDYPRASAAWVSGERIAPKSELGRDIRTLAAWMAQADIEEEQAKEKKPKKQLGWMDGVKHRLLGSKKATPQVAAEEIDAAGLAALAQAVGEDAGPVPVPKVPETMALARAVSPERLARRRRSVAAKAKGAGGSSGR